MTHVHVEAHGTIRHRWDVIQIDDAIALNGTAASSLPSLPPSPLRFDEDEESSGCLRREKAVQQAC
jgi:hypothetical protein